MATKYKYTHTYTICYKTAQGWQEIKTWSRPFTTGYKLNESLDIGYIDFHAQLIPKLSPFTPIRITTVTTDDIGAVVNSKCDYALIADMPKTLRTFV